MSMTEEKVTPLTVKQLLSEGEYVIPIYQRNYDWGEKEALQLLEDITDYAGNNSDQHYYIGSAVVFLRSVNGHTYYETIDGQQRLTTLTILVSLLKRLSLAPWFEKTNLTYDHRKEADESLTMLQYNRNSEHPAAQHIVDVFGLFAKHLPPVLKAKGLKAADFAEYLFERVIILRIPVPPDTQLNHYFEIMNTRGEQLEKHEVLKAALISKLHPEEHNLFHLIWEACSDMNAYVQMNFSIEQRRVIFDDQWVALRHRHFDALGRAFCEKGGKLIEADEEGAAHTLNSLFEDAKNQVRYELPSDGNSDDGTPDRFGSIANFPNFLLQALKVCYHDSEFYRPEVDEAIKLDDKGLILTFQTVLKSMADEEERGRFVRFFIMELLFLRIQYDRFVIKREYINDAESWSLKSLRKYDNNKVQYANTFSSNDSEEESEDHAAKAIRLLEAMFHISAPTQIYKHWLNAVLYAVYREEAITRSDLRKRLYDLARCFMLDVYLAGEGKVYGFEEIVFRDRYEPKNRIDEINWELIDCGCNVHNFIFNFYDFITWETDPKGYSEFDFTYRTSVEHFYPRKPMEGYPPLEKEVLNCFGNLCLISRGMNSKFSNNMPQAKLNNFGRIKEVRNGLSLKLLEMMDVVKHEGNWGAREIRAFEEHAQRRIKDALSKR